MNPLLAMISRTDSRLLAFLLLLSLVSIGLGERLSDEECSRIGYKSDELWCDQCSELGKFELDQLKPSCLQCCREDEYAKNKKFAFARLEYCECNISNFPQVKAFIRGDQSKKFPNLKIKFVRGITPILKLLDAHHNVVEELNIQKWDTDTIEEFLRERIG